MARKNIEQIMVKQQTAENIIARLKLLARAAWRTCLSAALA